MSARLALRSTEEDEGSAGRTSLHEMKQRNQHNSSGIRLRAATSTFHFTTTRDRHISPLVASLVFKRLYYTRSLFQFMSSNDISIVALLLLLNIIYIVFFILWNGYNNNLLAASTTNNKKKINKEGRASMQVK